MAKSRGIHVHHVVYRSKGGTNDLANLEVIHAVCHRQLHAGDRKAITTSSGQRSA
ncbi:HNH endonuclease [Nocardia puris]|uniref:HNH endonuclease n=3 Tax=Nocardiaceae TaxID=85025 RepID=UPI00397EBB5F